MPLIHPHLTRLLFAMAFLLLARPASASTNDPAAEFSTNSNPNGVWTYGYATNLASPYTLTVYPTNGNLGGLDYWTILTANNPWIAHNNTTNVVNLGFVVDPGMLTMHPGLNLEYAILRFAAPATGAFHLVGSFFGQDSTTTDVQILTNGAFVFASFVTGLGAPSAVAFDLNLNLNPGDTVDFAVGANGNKSFDSTGLTATIVSTPPTTNSTFRLEIFAGLTINAPIGSTNLVEYAENYAATNWLTLTNVVITTPDYRVYDPDSTSRKTRRFYRVTRLF